MYISFTFIYTALVDGAFLLFLSSMRGNIVT